MGVALRQGVTYASTFKQSTRCASVYIAPLSVSMQTRGWSVTTSARDGNGFLARLAAAARHEQRQGSTAHVIALHIQGWPLLVVEAAAVAAVNMAITGEKSVSKMEDLSGGSGDGTQIA